MSPRSQPICVTLRCVRPLILSLLAIPGLAQELTPLLDAIRTEARPSQALGQVREIWSRDRWSTFPKYAETAQYLHGTMRSIGLERVEVVNPPADGVTQYGFWTMPLAWDARSATLEILDPVPPAERTLADFQRIPASLGMWSGKTPLEGITAELIEYSPQADLRGKLVLTSRNSAGLKYDLVRAGALGAVNAFTENPKLEDGRQWINSWGDYGWAFTKASTPLLSFSITPRQAALLRKLLEKGAVKLRARVDARHYSGRYPYTTAVIPGKTEEEVLTLGHVSEQGAHDNATGVAVMLESLATLNRLIRAGKLSRPLRTIRMLAMGEYYGTHHYLASNPERIRRTVAAFCLDTPAAPYDLPGTEYTFHLNPHSGYAFTDAFILRLAGQYFASLNRPWHWKEFTPGTDSFLGEPSIGIPTTWPYSGTGVHSHHNSEDTPDHVDTRSLRDLIVVSSAYLYYLANASAGQAQTLARLTSEWARSRKLLPSVHNQAVLSTLRLASESGRAAFRQSLSPLLLTPEPALTTGPVIKRKRFGTIPLDDLPPDRREGWPNGAWAKRHAIALYWADGSRSLDEILRLTNAEAGPSDIDLPAYFRFLAQQGYIEMSGLPSTTSGAKTFSALCAHCHGSDGRGGERGPAINAPSYSDLALANLIRNGIPNRGMPPAVIPDAELRNLITHLRSLKPVESSAGIIAGPGPAFSDIVNPKPGQWLSYHGALSGNRYSSLDQISVANVARLAVRWMFSVPGAPRLQVTPVVFDGIMYVTAPNEAYALNAATGRQLWSFRRPRTRGLAGDAAAGINRGVAILGQRVFLVTDNAHLLALDRATGKLLWETTMADSAQNYGATSAPLVVNDLVIPGISGGDEGVRGFLAAYEASTGKEVWRFWTVPRPGEPGSETWQGKDIEHGCAATWMPGTFDPQTNTLFWTTGNPCPDYNGAERQGDNLYSDSVLALDPATGRLRWHYQFTPHDLHDWDAQQTPMLIDAIWSGQPRKLLLQANRNGFFYVLDRTNGKLLLAKPFVNNLTWATGVDLGTGRPILAPDQEPTTQGTRTCPAVEGATNWFSTAYNPTAGLFYVQAQEKCNIYSKSNTIWEAGKSYYGGDARRIPGQPGRKVLRALDIQTGRIVWEIVQDGPANTWGGVLSTAGNLIFFGHDSGDLAAANATTGELLWRFPANQTWKASPMTFSASGQQFVAVAAGPNVLAFALPSEGR